jgi:hypothetical protein
LLFGQTATKSKQSHEDRAEASRAGRLGYNVEPNLVNACSEIRSNHADNDSING